MGELRSKMESAMILKNYSKKTIKQYLFCVKEFVKYFSKDPRKLGVVEIEEYLHFMISSGKSWSHYRQSVSGLRFFYCVILEQEFLREKIPYPRRTIKRIPKALSILEVRAVLSVVENSKHLMMLKVIYATGVRVSELVNIKLVDLDSRKNLLRIIGKGNKERFTLLPDSLIKDLRSYWLTYKSKVYLFENKRGLANSITVAQKACVEASKKTNIKVNPHILRHSFATNLLEQGVDLLTIGKLLGHSNLKTTEIYTQVTTTRITNLTSPVELL
jgi:integrase/recombinase XerD